MNEHLSVYERMRAEYLDDERGSWHWPDDEIPDRALERLVACGPVGVLRELEHLGAAPVEGGTSSRTLEGRAARIEWLARHTAWGDLGRRAEAAVAEALERIGSSIRA